jgi:coproporphyrinogen III oxidase-like Fe-S oxidoreductase
LEDREKAFEGDKAEMERGLQAIQERCEEAFREQVSSISVWQYELKPQTRLEMDVEARDDLLDRLRSRLAMLEREVRESQRIAQVQVSP